ncbi:hypothetical protein ANN_08285 [Periplaneta americana]|uniref:Reverse transcriptase n=1 Tax=Periplaneta americana TaxID=6978 RepID=A0ABQ8T2L3_PERAM|nr:hypothetical protein ANN_08285 [Periplaneta americana]
MQMKHVWRIRMQSELHPNCKLRDLIKVEVKEGLLLVDIMPHGTTINSDAYVVTLKKLQARLSRVQRHWENSSSVCDRCLQTYAFKWSQRKKSPRDLTVASDNLSAIEFRPEEEMILRDMLLELNYNCELYGMKINANKTKIMVVARKIKKINLRILNEAVEQVDSFKYLECTISSNMSYSQEVKRRIAMAKEAFNRKRSIFCGSVEKEARKRLLKCFMWSVALYGEETWTLRRSEEKRREVFEMWIWRRMERVNGETE